MKKLTAVLLFVLFITCGNTLAFADCKLVTLMYHNVTQDSTRYDDYTIAPNQLEEDIEIFKNAGYTLMTASELADTHISELEGKKVLLLTFDDGYIGWYSEVFPILKKHKK